jgi:hypothetical protein
MDGVYDLTGGSFIARCETLLNKYSCRTSFSYLVTISASEKQAAEIQKTPKIQHL